MKIPMDMDSMFEKDLLKLAKACIRELNDRGLEQFKIVKKW
jgi:hypothetical protein